MGIGNKITAFALLGMISACGTSTEDSNITGKSCYANMNACIGGGKQDSSEGAINLDPSIKDHNQKYLGPCNIKQNDTKNNQIGQQIWTWENGKLMQVEHQLNNTRNITKYYWQGDQLLQSTMTFDTKKKTKWSNQSDWEGQCDYNYQEKSAGGCQGVFLPGHFVPKYESSNGEWSDDRRFGEYLIPESPPLANCEITITCSERSDTAADSRRFIMTYQDSKLIEVKRTHISDSYPGEPISWTWDSDDIYYYNEQGALYAIYKNTFSDWSSSLIGLKFIPSTDPANGGSPFSQNIVTTMSMESVTYNIRSQVLDKFGNVLAEFFEKNMADTTKKDIEPVMQLQSYEISSYLSCTGNTAP